MNGISTNATAKNPGTADAQWMPNLAYIWSVNNGKAAPNKLLRITFPAKAEAAKTV